MLHIHVEGCYAARMELIIHIDWRGPFTLAQTQILTDAATDFGLYQVYAEHPVYGRCLVYLGRARSLTFGQRVAQHRWDTGSEMDPAKVEIYVGRLKGQPIPSIDEQN